MLHGKWYIKYIFSHLFLEYYLKINIIIPCTLYKEMGCFQSQRSFCYNLSNILISLYVYISFSTNMSNLIYWGKIKTNKLLSSCTFVTRKPLSALRSSRKFKFEKDSWPYFLFLLIFSNNPKWCKRQCILIQWKDGYRAGENGENYSWIVRTS